MKHDNAAGSWRYALVVAFFIIVFSTAGCNQTQRLSNQPPVVSFEANPSSGTAPLTVVFTFAASDPDGDQLTCSLDFGDGSPPAKGCIGAVTHTYADAGSYIASFSVDDGHGHLQQRVINILATSESQPNAFAFYFSPEDFQGEALAFTVPQGRILIGLVPGMMPDGYYKDNKNYWKTPFSFNVEVVSSSTSLATPRSLPTFTKLEPRNWDSPYQAPYRDPPRRRFFEVWGPGAESYVRVEGQLVYAGDEFLFYEEKAKNGAPSSCFSLENYQIIDAKSSGAYAEVKRLMGHASDFDGNRKIIVFLSTTFAEIWNVWHAAFYSDDIRPDSDKKSEIIYFPCAAWKKPSYRASTWFPRNIIHESVHLHQAVHAYRRGTPNLLYGGRWPFNEAQAQLFRHKLQMGLEDQWSRIKRCLFDKNILTMTTNGCEYDTGALVHWWMHQHYGEGFEQALIEAFFKDHIRKKGGPYLLAVGLPAPLASVLTFLSMHLDETAVGAELGLDFPEDNIPLRMNGNPPPAFGLNLGSPVGVELKYLQSAVIKYVNLNSKATIRVTVDRPEKGYVVVVVVPR